MPRTLTPAQLERLDRMTAREEKANVCGWDDAIGGPVVRGAAGLRVLAPNGRFQLAPPRV